MSLTADEEILIREKIAQKITASGELPLVVPSPIYFKDKADFFAVLSPQTTQKAIEATPAKFAVISYLRFEDNFEEGCEDEPLISLFYKIHVFREYDFLRIDENDSFLKRVLRSEREFLSAVFNVRQEFLGIQDLSGFPNGWTVQTYSLEQPDFALEKERAEYIGNAQGFSLDFILKVEVLISEG